MLGMEEKIIIENENVLILFCLFNFKYLIKKYN